MPLQGFEGVFSGHPIYVLTYVLTFGAGHKNNHCHGLVALVTMTPLHIYYNNFTFRSLIVRIIKQRPRTELPQTIVRSGGSNSFDLDSDNSVTEDYIVVKIISHPEFDKNKINEGDNIIVLIVDHPIQLSSKSGVNAACYPQCKTKYLLCPKKQINKLLFQTFQLFLLGENMFDHVFSNGTGTRCWVAGIMF